MTLETVSNGPPPQSEHLGFYRRDAAWRRILRDRATLAGAVVSGFIAIACVFGPMLVQATWGYTYHGQDLELGPTPPGVRHWFGTDYFGRDLLTRVLYGGRVSLLVGLLAASVAAGIGTIYGAVSGYAGGRVDHLMMRAVDVAYALPYMFVVIILVAMFNATNLVSLFVGLGMVGWLMTARIVRGQVLSLKEREFVLAARCLGGSSVWILRKHLIPNSLGPVIVYFTLTVPSMILQEAFLSFLGLGVQAPQPSLGALINDGAQHMTIFWWELVAPGAVLAALLFSLNFVGDGVRDALEPKSDMSRGAS